VTTAQSAVGAADAAVDNTRAQLLGAISSACSTLYAMGLNCANPETPLSADSMASVASFMQSRVGDTRSDFGIRATAVLTTNAALRSALANAVATRDTLAAARAKLDALTNPSALDLATAQAQLAAARDTLEAKTAPTEADRLAADAAVNRASAALSVAVANLARSRLVAPFDGIVLQRLAEPGANVTPQTAVLTIASRSIEVRASLSDLDAVRVRPGMTVEVAAPGVATPVTGRVTGIAPAEDARTRLVEARITLDRAEPLRPGMPVEVRFIAEQRASALSVPREAVVDLETNPRVYAVADGSVRVRPVKLGLADHARVEVVEGLREGEVIVLHGHSRLRDGQQVRANRE
jgi:RND family efflux transporter MFP subunit